MNTLIGVLWMMAGFCALLAATTSNFYMIWIGVAIMDFLLAATYLLREE